MMQPPMQVAAQSNPQFAARPPMPPPGGMGMGMMPPGIYKSYLYMYAIEYEYI